MLWSCLPKTGRKLFHRSFNGSIFGNMGCAAPHPLHWVDLRSRITGSRDIRFLNAVYRVDPEKETIQELEPHPERLLTRALQILLIRYLAAQPGPSLSGAAITEKELPGGPTFFQGPHELQLGPLIERFGKDSAGFLARARELGGELEGHGDASIRFHPLEGIPVTIILWEADEEFPASVSVLFDKSICEWFELDMVFILVEQLILRIVDPS